MTILTIISLFFMILLIISLIISMLSDILRDYTYWANTNHLGEYDLWHRMYGLLLWDMVVLSFEFTSLIYIIKL